MSAESPYSKDKRALIAEVRALLLYAAERNLLTAGTTEATEAIRTGLLEPLAAALARYESSGTDTEDARRIDVLFFYSALNRLTGSVTGRSYLDSAGTGGRANFIVGVSIALLVTTIALELAFRWNVEWVKDIYPFAGPLAWGAVGSCLYLLKSLSDRVADFQFDSRLLKGIPTRITIGAILGMVAVRLFDIKITSGSTTEELALPAVAFLSGLGAKVVYGAIENIIEALAERLTFSALRRAEAAKPVDSTVVLPSREAAPINALDRRTVVPSIRSLARTVQEQLATLGYQPGPVDGVIGPRTLSAIQDFLPDATEEEAKRLDLPTLLKWVRNGKAPADWRDALEVATKARDQREAPMRRMFEHLKAANLVDRAAAPDDFAALRALVLRGVRELEQRPEFKGKSFSQILEALDKPAPRSLNDDRA